MAARKPLLGVVEPDAELLNLMAERRKTETTEEDLREQRISYAYGNAMHTENITKASVRTASEKISLRA